MQELRTFVFERSLYLKLANTIDLYLYCDSIHPPILDPSLCDEPSVYQMSTCAFKVAPSALFKYRHFCLLNTCINFIRIKWNWWWWRKIPSLFQRYVRYCKLHSGFSSKKFQFNIKINQTKDFHEFFISNRKFFRYDL